MSDRPTVRLRIVTAFAATVAALLAPGVAQGADRIYWANFGAPERISFANLDGSGGVNLNTAGAIVKIPIGLDLDPAGGRAYWTNQSGPGGISFANLDGSGAGGNLNTGGGTTKGPSGAAIDPVARRIYWGNIGNGTISWANLDGSGGGNLNTGAATTTAPYALEVDPVGRKVYWTNTVKAGVISWANLDGSGGGDLSISGTATLENPFGLAIDGQRIYWANSIVSGRISSANLDGSGSADINTIGATVSEPYGVAVDSARHRVYWANSGGGLGSADTNGTGGSNLAIVGGFASGTPNFPNLLEAPAGAAPPALTGSAMPGSTLGCSQGFWKPDVSSASRYRAPTAYAYQWSRNGTPLAGATSATLTARDVGEYRCTVTASNAAGSAAQTSALGAVFRIGKVRLNRKKGIAKLPVSLPGGGTLKVSGRGVRSATKSVAVAKSVTLTIRAKGNARKKLAKSGKAKLRLAFNFLTFSPGSFNALQTKTLVLRKK
jgi:DNA-binding beta-propeller fold protein YncE